MEQIDRLRWNTEIGERLAKLRRHAGFDGRGTKTRFAAKFGFDPERWCRWERGRSQFPVKEAHRLVDAFQGLTLDWIYQGADPHNDTPILRVLQA